MTAILAILAAAAAAMAVARWQRLPAAPMLLLAGIALNALGVLPEPQTVRDIMLLGLTFLVFFVGAELDPRRMRGQLRAAIGIGLAQFLVLGLLGVLATVGVGFTLLTGLYVGLAITASSTLMVVTLLQQREQFFEPFGRLVVGVLLVQDLLVVLLLPLLVNAEAGPLAMAQGVGATAALLAVAAVVLQWIGPAVVPPLERDQESLLLAVLTVLFVFVGAAHWLGVPIVTGAFLAGVALSGFPVRGVLRGQVMSLADFFLAVFFVALGALVRFPSPQQMMVEGMLLAGLLILTPPLVMLIARRAGLTQRAAIEGGHLLAQCGEFSLVVAVLGVQQGHIGENVLAIIVLLAAATMTVTPVVATDTVTWGMLRLLSHRHRRPVEERSGHVLLLGCGSHMQQVVERLVRQGREVVVVDDDAAAVLRAREAGAVALRGDGADFRMLRAVRARQAAVVVSTMRRLEDNLRLVRFVQGPSVLVRVFSPEAGRRIEASGATAIVEAEATAEAFLDWFDRQFAESAQP